MNGPVKADLGHDDDGIQFEWTVGGLELTVLKQYGAVSASGVMLRFAGAYQQDDTGGGHVRRNRRSRPARDHRNG
ncbi:phage major tail tube protein [Pseudomonas aeruginosa]|nr:phage major tail tube protein [Pseudomonas aeruginosa]